MAVDPDLLFEDQLHINAKVDAIERRLNAEQAVAAVTLNGVHVVILRGTFPRLPRVEGAGREYLRLEVPGPGYLRGEEPGLYWTDPENPQVEE